MRFIKYYWFLFGLTALVACKKEDPLNVDNITGLGGDTWVKTPLDQWLYDSLVVPYNIATKYKWDQSELDLNKDIVPPDESKVIPVMSSVSRVWIDPYILQGGEVFFQKIFSQTLCACRQRKLESRRKYNIGHRGRWS